MGTFTSSVALGVCCASLIHEGDVGAEEPKEEPRPLYALQVFKIDVLPTKLDGMVWDGTTVLKNLPDPKGMSLSVVASAAVKKIAEAGLDATAAPDVYAVVEAAGKTLQTSVKQDTYQAAWGGEEQQVTMALRPGDFLKIVVYDRDLQENTKDIIGSALHKLTDDELKSGVVELQDFDQVRLMDVVLKPVTQKQLTFQPGRYRLTVAGAAISALKPAGMKNAGKAWDILGGSPDTAGTVSVGSQSMALPKVEDSLSPRWNVSMDVDLDESSSVSVALVDKDLSEKSDDSIGTAKSAQLLAEPSSSDGRIHLTDHAGIVDLAIELKPAALVVSREECRALTGHLAKLGAAAGAKDLVEKLKKVTEQDLTECANKLSRTDFDCVMKAADLPGVAVCNPMK